MSDSELEKLTVLSGRPMDDGMPPRRRVVTRMFYRLGGDTLKVFVESRAPELIVEPFDTDRDLAGRMGTAEAIDLIVWRQRPGESDVLSDVRTVLGPSRRAPVLLMVDSYDAALVSRAMAHGIAGLVSTHMSADTILCVLRLILANGTYFPCEPAWFAPMPAPEVAAAPNLQRGAYGLTPRQLDVLGYICQGMSNKIIARALGMRETTVKAHVMQIMRRLNADNRTQVALRVAQTGFLSAHAMPAAQAKD
jgi:two-component system, NarL family, nitrate/nitrite response regulator NarL